ncbi:MAG: 4Fe-4S dicluster domain-containing protein [Desulfosalsimonas sp.]
MALDQQLCTGCGICTVVCPREVLSMKNGRAEIADRDACMECGAFAVNCPAGALSVQAGVGCAPAVINSALGRKRGRRLLRCRNNPQGRARLRAWLLLTFRRDSGFLENFNHPGHVSGRQICRAGLPAGLT